MSKQEPGEAQGRCLTGHQILVDDFGYTTEQTRQYLPFGKTKFFTDILPQLESYLEGTRRIVIGRSIREYRERKLAERHQKRPTEHLRKPKNEKRRHRETEGAVAFSTNDPRPEPSRQQERADANKAARKTLQRTNVAPRR